MGTKIPKNNKEDTQWVCAQGHKFDNDYNNIQQYNCFCRYCKKPFMGQMVTKLYLEGLTGLNFQTSRPKFLTYENGSPLELDGYNKEAAIAFEYNGIEHYEKSARQSQEAFEKLQKRDTWKYQKVMENNIKLLIIKEINGKFNEQHIKNSVLDFILREKIKLVENYKSITVDFPTMHSNYYLKNIKKACKSLNLTLIDTKYINSITPILIKCDLCLMERRVSPGNICHMANKGRKTYCSCTRKQKS